MICFTIASRNFIGYVQTLWTSLKRHHPELRFYLVLCDAEDALLTAALPYPVVPMSALGIARLDEMTARYNITELNTSLKPFAFLHLFDRHPGEPVCYLDPDILALSRFAELEALLAGGADCVLTPHILGPAEHADMSDRKFLTYGIYNLGFCALRDTPEVRRVAAWWGRRLERDCVIDLAQGLFVDQKWADYLPAFVGRTAILRHPGYNVAYWNLAERRLAHEGGHWLVNGEALRFFHFSGNRIEEPGTFTRHSKQFTPENTPELADLLAEYRAEIYRNGHAYYSGLSYAFSWSGEAGQNEHTPEALRRQAAADAAPHLPVERARSLPEFEADRRHNADTIASRRAIEASLIPAEETFTLDGYCVVCGTARAFQVSSMYASGMLPDGRAIPNWREHLNCLGCGIVNRTRGALAVLNQEFAPAADARVYVTEQVTPLFGLLRRRWPALQGSEYLSPDLRGGSERDGIRHEDVQRLSFVDASFDLVLSFDVLEHVPFLDRALAEIARVLAPGGRLLFTVPFSYRSADHVVRAVEHPDGRLEHLMEPEYHGNPVDMDKGSLCYRYFGWSVLGDLERAGFRDVEVLSYWSVDLAHLGEMLFVITGRVPA